MREEFADDKLRPLRAHLDKKMVAQDELEAFSKECKNRGNTIATINGSFDLLHTGHLFMLFEASRVADVLLVAINSDESIKAYKGTSRPIKPLKERMEQVAAIGFVDFVTWFDEEDPRHVLSIVKPDIHVNGAEYGQNCIEAEVVKQNGGKLHLLPRIGSWASSSIVNKVKGLEENETSL